MKLFNTILLIPLFIAFAGNSLCAQKAIKLEKQQTTFSYVQLNLHAGYLHDPGDNRWDLTNKSPGNQVTFQLFSKRQHRLQKGYTRLISLISWKFRFSLAYDKSVDANDIKSGTFKFKLNDLWAKFGTKWDRTTITVGKRSLPYGHSPQLDPASSFMANIIKTDFGFNRDVGIFLKTPVSAVLDLECALTTGGWLNSPPFTYGNVLKNEALPDDQSEFTTDFSYNNTWLATARLGSPSFKKHEFGLLTALGYIPSTFISDEMMHIYRIGGEWLYKHHELFKVTNQATTGPTLTATRGNFLGFNMQNSIDVFLVGKFIISFSHSLSIFGDLESENDFLSGNLAGSFTYAITPHTRLRCNLYASYKNGDTGAPRGILLQFVTGIGKR